MSEILLPACQFPRLSDGATCRDIQPQALCQACTAHVQVAALRARLESVEQAEKAAAVWEQRCSQATALSGNHLADLAAALRRTEQAERECDDLRARLENAETARRDAQESRFVLIIQNEELGAELADLRARLENAEQERDRLRKVLRDLLPFADEKSNAYAWAKATLDAAALGAAGERSEDA